MNNSKQSYVIADGVYSQEVGEETVILDMNGELYFSLNEVGTKIWKMLGKSNNIEEIVCSLEREYSAERYVLRKDLEILIQKLVASHLIYMK